LPLGPPVLTEGGGGGGGGAAEEEPVGSAETHNKKDHSVRNCEKIYDKNKEKLEKRNYEEEVVVVGLQQDVEWQKQYFHEISQNVHDQPVIHSFIR
jgi:hypothetical protein